ncbi:MAG: hypothetical protein M5U19_01175 [Microthrixaceae bacterium]|nr:hypothetical protein [Microthrixaceae bacterium]
MAQEVRWRSDGHQISHDSTIDILRFEVEDLNMVIKNCVAVAELYAGLAERGGLQNEAQVIPVSCFAVTADWTPQRLAEGTRYRSYRLVSARTLLAAGFPIWPTEVFLDGAPDPRNEVHYDVIVATGELHLAEFFSQVKAARAAARDRLRPAFERLCDLLGDPRDL